MADKDLLIKDLYPTREHMAADTLRRVLNETQEQPAWRNEADKEMDYYDGNQLDSNALQALGDLGLPPAVENLIAPAIDDICGMEAKNRTDFKVIPDGDIHDQESDMVARALGYKLNKAERASGADKACAMAYKTQVGVGLGWVEVSRNSDPMRYPYRAGYVHRNEIWWDWLSKEWDLDDSRWLLRRRWTDIDLVSKVFPGKKDLIMRAGTGWNIIDDLALMLNDSGGETGLAMAMEIERGWSIEDMEWRMPESRRVCVYELWTRSWEPGLVLKMPGGRVVEFDDLNDDHQMAVYLGIPLQQAMLTRIHKSYLLGPHLLHTEQSEFTRFPYVPFFGKREDRTNVPYGIIRHLKYLQDEVNSRVSKMAWLLSAKRTVRTKGAVKMEDDVFRYEVGRPDADIILDANHMSQPGSTFEVQDDLQLNQQQYERLLDIRQTMKHISGVSDAFSGDGGSDSASGINALIEQTVQSLAAINDNYAYARQQVGELLLGMIIRDMGSEPEKVMMYADNPLRETVEVQLNAPYQDDLSGRRLLTNDVQRTKLKVVLEEVPSTPSFRRQALVSLAEAFKSASPVHQQVMLPHLMNLTDVPDKEAIIEAILEINRNQHLTEEQVEERIKEAIEQDRVKNLVAQKDRDLDLKEKKMEAEIEKIVAEIVNEKIESIYASVQAGVQLISMPGAAGAADQVLNSSGFEDEDQAPIVAEPGAATGSAGPPLPVRENTSPMFPPRPAQADSGALTGIEKLGVQNVAVQEKGTQAPTRPNPGRERE